MYYSIYVCVHLCITVYMCVYTCVLHYIGVCTCVLQYIGVYTCVLQYICVCTCVLQYICVCTCVLQYIDVCTLVYSIEQIGRMEQVLQHNLFSVFFCLDSPRMSKQSNKKSSESLHNTVCHSAMPILYVCQSPLYATSHFLTISSWSYLSRSLFNYF